MIKKLQKRAAALVAVCLLGISVFSCKKSAPSLSEQDVNVLQSTSSSKIIVDSVFSVKEIASAELERARLAQMQLHTDFSPTGFYLPKNGTVTVDVKITSGNRAPTLIIGTLSRYAAMGGTINGNLTYVKLKEGENTITDANGGLIYLQYSNSFLTGEVSSTVTFKSGMKAAPFFQLGKTSNEDWRNMLSAFNDAPDVILSSQKMMLVVSMKNAYKYQKEDVNALLQKIDLMYNAEDKFSGLDGSTAKNAIPLHKILVTEMDKGPSADRNYMFTWSKRTAFKTEYANQFLTLSGFATDEGWSTWHEAGHMHQQTAWTWTATEEVTVNLYALAAQRALGGMQSEIVSRDVWAKVGQYFAQPNRDFNASVLNFDTNTMNWIRLCMFQQLWLQYGDDFYIKLAKATRESPPMGYLDQDKMSYFMLMASKITGNDLSGFFQKWGFKLSASAYSKVAALNLAAPNKDLTQLRD